KISVVVILNLAEGFSRGSALFFIVISILTWVICFNSSIACFPLNTNGSGINESVLDAIVSSKKSITLLSSRRSSTRISIALGVVFTILKFNQALSRYFITLSSEVISTGASLDIGGNPAV